MRHCVYATVRTCLRHSVHVHPCALVPISDVGPLRLSLMSCVRKHGAVNAGSLPCTSSVCPRLVFALASKTQSCSRWAKAAVVLASSFLTSSTCDCDASKLARRAGKLDLAVGHRTGGWRGVARAELAPQTRSGAQLCWHVMDG